MKWDGALYDSQGGPQREAGAELIRMAAVGEFDHVLDIGCGTGNQTIELATLASKGSVTGLDPSEEMLVRAREKAASFDNVSFTRARVQDMDYDGMFDLAFSNLALQWVKDHESAMKRVYRALRQNGRISFQMPAKGFCPEFFEYIDAAIAGLGCREFFLDWDSPWYFPDVQEYAELLDRTGFRNLRVFCREYQSLFDGTDAVLHWLVGAGLRPYLSRLPEDRQEYMKYAVAMNFEKSRTPDGIAVTFKRLFAFAEK